MHLAAAARVLLALALTSDLPPPVSGNELAAAAGTTSAAGKADGSCCDAHPALCKSLSPQPQPRTEVVAFHAPGMYGETADAWKNYDWDKVTAVGMFTFVDPEMLCLAHSKVGLGRIVVLEIEVLNILVNLV
jgi:hypothetical protein